MSEIPEFVEIPSAEYQEQQISFLVNHPAFVDAFHKLLEKKLPGIVAPVVKRIWESLLMNNLEPTMENLFGKVLKEVLEEKLNSAGTWISKDASSSSEPRKLTLEFLGNVSPKVYTGEPIKGEGGDDIGVALFDADHNIVKSGTEASSEVDLMVLLENSGSSGKEPRMPLVSPSRLKLKEGIAVLQNVQLKRPVAQSTRRCSVWAQNCTIRLVARSIGDIEGATVERAETGSFLFGDRRGTLYNKHYPPQLSDEVWRLRKIRRNHELHKLLEKKNINSVEQFLIAHTKDPQSLQKMLKISDNKLKIIADHAKTCPDIPESLHVYHSASWKSNNAVVSDVVGCARGLLYEGQGFVPADNLPEHLKVDAQKKVVSAFENWEDVRPYDIEASTSNEAFGVLDRASSRTGNHNGSTLEPYVMADEADHPAIISRGNIRSPFSSSPDWLGNRSMQECSDSDDLQNWMNQWRSRGRLITFIVSVEKFISTLKGAMAQEVEARALKKQKCG